MITSVRFQNYKALREVTLPLQRLNVLVGANAAGKSTALGGLDLLVQIAMAQKAGELSIHTQTEPAEQRVLMGRTGQLVAGRVVHQCPTRPAAKDFCLAVDLGGRDTLQALFTPTGHPEEKAGGPFEFRLSLTISGPRGGGQEKSLEVTGLKSTAIGTKEIAFYRTLEQLQAGPVSWLRLSATQLAAPHYASTAAPQLSEDGTGLASVLQHLQGLRDGTLEAIERDLARLIPRARRIRALLGEVEVQERKQITIEQDKFITDRPSRRIGARFEVEFSNIGWIAAEQLSEGTLLLLGLITVLRHQAPRLLLLDDLDKSLHPGAQVEMIKLLRGLLEEKPDLQIVATSHSPFLLNGLGGEEAHVFSLDSHGHTRARLLSTHPLWEKRKSFMFPGEFWSGVGEDWVVEDPS